MAKLTARGATVLLRGVQKVNVNDDEVLWLRHEKALRSDGKVLKRTSIKYQPDVNGKAGRLETWNWTIHGTAKKDWSIEKLIDYWESNDYVVTRMDA